MANFIMIVDSDAERRNRFIRAVQPVVAPVEGLITDTCATGDFCAIWAAAEAAPVSDVADDDGAAVIWGEAINGTERIDATALRTLWRQQDSYPELVFDGFYAAAVYRPDFGLIVGADILGMFPVYYYATQDVVLAGSSPELFKHHPSFQTQLDPVGLVGILLTMHILNGRTLLEGVRRLAAGHALVWRPGTSAKEIPQYQLPVSNRYFDLPFSAHVDILDQALDNAVARHAPDGKRYSQLFSGGLDSRMLAGYLSEKGIHNTAVTLGLRSDIEMKCAIPAARTLGIEHRVVNVGYDQYPACAELHAKWEHVASGFNCIMNWGVYPYLRGLAPRVIAGFALDGAIGTSWIEKAYVPLSRTMSFEAFFSHINRWGISPDVLKQLLRHEIFGELVEEEVARIRAVYESYSELESQRAWCFNLQHRQRLHVGGMAWQLSFGAWPVLPALDRRVLETGGGMPAASIAERRAQKEVLCRRFPRLAALPLDHNSFDFEPLRPRIRRQVARHIQSQFRRLRLVKDPGKDVNGERRYYYRVFDFNGPGWTAVRREAEPYRDRVTHLFSEDPFEKLLPPPDVRLQFANGIPEASGLKSLVGLLLWSKDHL
jgi:asparagine synthase (glutamine-hydrolysing)